MDLSFGPPLRIATQINKMCTEAISACDSIIRFRFTWSRTNCSLHSLSSQISIKYNKSIIILSPATYINIKSIVLSYIFWHILGPVHQKTLKAYWWKRLHWDDDWHGDVVFLQQKYRKERSFFHRQLFAIHTCHTLKNTF